MKKKTVNLVTAYHIDIFCKMNDWQDIKCGGSPTLGFDFYVSGNKVKWEKDIKKLLEKYNRKYESINIRKITDFREDWIWTFERIEECISKEDPYNW